MEFYSLLTTQAKTPKILSCKNLKWDDYLNLTNGNYSNYTFPLKFIETGGRDWVDIISPSVGFFVISEKFKNILLENNLTGWRSFDIIIFDKEGKKFNQKYFGLSIIGKTGSIQYEKSIIVEKSFKSGDKYKTYVGAYFNEETWSCLDFSIIDKTIITCITENTANILTKAKLTNLVLEPLSKKETSEHALPTWAKEQLGIK